MGSELPRASIKTAQHKALQGNRDRRHTQVWTTPCCELRGIEYLNYHLYMNQELVYIILLMVVEKRYVMGVEMMKYIGDFQN